MEEQKLINDFEQYLAGKKKELIEKIERRKKQDDFLRKITNLVDNSTTFNLDELIIMLYEPDIVNITQERAKMIIEKVNVDEKLKNDEIVKQAISSFFGDFLKRVKDYHQQAGFGNEVDSVLNISGEITVESFSGIMKEYAQRLSFAIPRQTFYNREYQNQIDEIQQLIEFMDNSTRQPFTNLDLAFSYVDASNMTDLDKIGLIRLIGLKNIAGYKKYKVKTRIQEPVLPVNQQPIIEVPPIVEMAPSLPVMEVSEPIVVKESPMIEPISPSESLLPSQEIHKQLEIIDLLDDEQKETYEDIVRILEERKNEFNSLTAKQLGIINSYFETASALNKENPHEKYAEMVNERLKGSKHDYISLLCLMQFRDTVDKLKAMLEDENSPEYLDLLKTETKDAVIGLQKILELYENHLNDLEVEKRPIEVISSEDYVLNGDIRLLFMPTSSTYESVYYEEDIQKLYNERNLVIKRGDALKALKRIKQGNGGKKLKDISLVSAKSSAKGIYEEKSTGKGSGVIRTFYCPIGNNNVIVLGICKKADNDLIDSVKSRIGLDPVKKMYDEFLRIMNPETGTDQERELLYKTNEDITKRILGDMQNFIEGKRGSTRTDGGDTNGNGN